MAERLTVRDIQQMKLDGVPIPVLTAYDVVSARLGEAAGAAILLVGDSLGMVIQGHDTPIPVTLDQAVYHAAIVSRVTHKPLIVGDLPFLTYNLSPAQALESAGRLMQQGGVGAVKMEGGAYLADTIARVVEAGIPVMGHVGLQPQSVHQVGGMRVQGRDLEAAQRIIRDAEAVAQAGAFALVIESVPGPVAEIITQRLRIPTIGIGAGVHCDGQVQVFHDLLGLFPDFTPRHTRHYVDGWAVLLEALRQYISDVQSRAFPTEANTFTMKPELVDDLKRMPVNGHASAGQPQE
ncbi:MAG: 3-methyl-2-oxobutanoate hydroxymethyltransferase [Candidatus Flexifilum sp.]|jgi:3-methyl-2-oxobutanoate hydroxymethyltransferase